MIIEKTDIYEEWFSKLKNLAAKIRIIKRLERIENNNFGDVKSVGDGIYEIRIDFGCGYRIYFSYKNKVIILLLCGGDKSTQQKDIEKAKIINKELGN